MPIGCSNIQIFECVFPTNRFLSPTQSQHCHQNWKVTIFTLVPHNTQPSDLDATSHTDNIFDRKWTLQEHTVYSVGLLVSNISQWRFSYTSTRFHSGFLRCLSAVSPVPFQFGGQWTALCLPLSYGSKKSCWSSSLSTFLLVRTEWLLPNRLHAEPETRCPFSLFQSGRAPWSSFNFHNL